MAPPVGSGLARYQWRPTINVAVSARALCARHYVTFENAERPAAYCWVNRGTTIASDSKWIRIFAFRVSRLNIFRLSRSAARTLEAVLPTTRASARRPNAGELGGPCG